MSTQKWSLESTAWLMGAFIGRATSIAISIWWLANCLCISSRLNFTLAKLALGACSASASCNLGKTIGSIASCRAILKVCAVVAKLKSPQACSTWRNFSSKSISSGAIRWHAGVGSINCPWRSNNGSFNTLRKRFIAWLTAEGVMYSTFAVSLMFFSRYRHSNILSKFKSNCWIFLASIIITRPHYECNSHLTGNIFHLIHWGECFMLG